jgi:hypothetical protein
VIVPRRLSLLLAPIARLFARKGAAVDAWGRSGYGVPPGAFGSGHQHDFSWYFEGESAVSVESVEDVQTWLLTCEYVNDQALFNEPDFWQHPRTFEQLRRGDCEDHALWAWRKLVELGLDADLVSGSVLQRDGEAPDRGAHVWVVLRQEGQTFLFETVAKAKDRMLQPLDAHRARYRPEFGVDRNRRPFAFNGAVAAFREQQGKPGRATGSPAAGVGATFTRSDARDAV